jgi:subtilisin family serine protease
MNANTYVVFPRAAGVVETPLKRVTERLRGNFPVHTLRGPRASDVGESEASSGGRSGGAEVMVLPVLGLLLATGPANIEDHLKKDEDVREVVPSSALVAKVPEMTVQATLASVDAWHLSALGVEKAHNVGVRGEGVWVGVVDSGIVATHPEFSDRDVLFRAFDASGKEVVGAAFDHHGHGTHVAGIVAGRSVGVAPKAGLAVANAFPNGYGEFAQVLAGLEWLASLKRPDGERGVDIINLSFQFFTPLEDGRLLGLCRPYQTVLERLAALDIEVVAASGNSGPGTVASPANFPGVLSVGALDRDGQIWDGSGSGLIPEAKSIPKPDILAPGVGVISASGAGGYAQMTGTSMATPAVSGLAALLRQQQGQAAGFDLRTALRSHGSKLHVAALGLDVLVARYGADGPQAG